MTNTLSTKLRSTKKILVFRQMIILLAISLVGMAACTPGGGQITVVESSQHNQRGAIQVLAVESFLADIAQNVTGERVKVESLMPDGVDPHAFEPTPKDIARISDSNVLIINGAGLEQWLSKVLENAGGERLLIEASAGLSQFDYFGNEKASTAPVSDGDHPHGEGDPHFWLDPNLVMVYVENIRDSLSQADPDGKDIYARNAEKYIRQLRELDQYIQQQVSTLPQERRQMVTNHESFGYFADRYGFTIIGTVIPSVSSGAAPSAQQLASLVDRIKETGAAAIFLESGANPQLANQVAKETGVKVVTDLYTHTLTGPAGGSPSYIGMMKYNVEVIVNALK